MSRRWLVGVLVMLVALGCRRASTGADGGTEPQGAVPIVLRPDSEGLLLTWIDEKGDFHVEQKVEDVPMVGRDAVRVVDPTKDEGTHSDRIFVADLRTTKPDGTYDVRVTTRAEFEAMAVERRKVSGPTLAEAQEAQGAGVASGSPSSSPPAAAQGRAAVIIYGAEWCGPCHEAAAYLRKKGVAFVEKDVDKDREASREMQQKLARAGLRAGSIPVLDVRGKLLVGFSPHAVDEALGRAL